MEIQGTYTLQASPEEVWQCLMDQQTLWCTIPGITQLEGSGEHIYTFTMHIKHAPLKGSYSGHVRVVEQHYPASYSITAEGEGPQSRFHGEWDIHFSELKDNTVITYKGTIHLGKVSSLLPMPMVKGTIKVLIQQFFTALADQLRITSHTYMSTSEDSHGRAVSIQPLDRRSVVVPSTGKPTLLHTIVHQLSLGAGDPISEEQWITRLRRIGTISVLLFLVWVGTRLPEKLLSHERA